MSIALILDNEGKWVKGATAMNSSGELVEACATDACKWCIFGAMWKAHRRFGEPFWVKWNSLVAYVKRLGFDTVGHWNDDPRTTFADVRKAIQVCNL